MIGEEPLPHYFMPARDTEDPGEQDDDVALPPLDDGDGEEEENGARDVEDVDDAPVLPDEESDDPFDDSTASDLETGLDIGIEDKSAREGDEPAEEGIDVGPLDDGLSVRDTYGDADDDRPGTGGDDDDFDIHPDTRGDDDGGAEGMEDGTEGDVNEEDLPGLDADEEGDFEAEDVVAEMSFEADSTLPPWDALRWTALEGAGAPVPCSALAVAGGRVAAGGEVVLVVDEGAHAARRAGFEGGASAVAITDGAVVAAHRGQLWIERDAGGAVAPLIGWRGGQGPVELAASPARLWILSEGSLWSMPPSGGPATQARARGTARIAATGAAVIALTQSEGGPAIERLRGDDEGWRVAPLGEDARDGGAGSAASAASAARQIAESEGAKMAAGAGGRLIALANKESVCVSRDGGETFTAIQLPEAAALAFAGESERAPLLVLIAREVDSSAFVVMVPEAGEPTRIAELPPCAGDPASEDDEGGAFGSAAMEWDTSREAVWVACRAGLIALARARKH
jgi:hypothetical protein